MSSKENIPLIVLFFVMAIVISNPLFYAFFEEMYRGSLNTEDVIIFLGMMLVITIPLYVFNIRGSRGLRLWAELSHEIGDSPIEEKTILRRPVSSFKYHGHIVSLDVNRYSDVPINQANSFFIDCSCDKTGMVINNIGRFVRSGRLPEKMVRKYNLSPDAEKKILGLGKGKLYAIKGHLQFDVGNIPINDKAKIKEIIDKVVDISDALSA